MRRGRYRRAAAAPHQPKAETVEVGDDQPISGAFHQPLHEMSLFVGAYLDGVTSLHAIPPATSKATAASMLANRR